MSQTGAKTRAAAARVVDAVVTQGRSLDAALAEAEPHLPDSELSLLRALAYGVLRYHWRLSDQIDQYLTRPLKRRDAVIHALLAVGVYQLADMRIGTHAAVNLTVEAARKLKRPKLAGLVNGILRAYLREPPDANDPVPADTSEVGNNHPRWLIDRIRADWPEHWSQILAANNERAPMWLRVNAQTADADVYLASIQARPDAAGAVVGHLEPGLAQAIRLERPSPVDALPDFDAGAVSVQDGAAQLAAPWLLGETPGATERILDLCAAPGGKTGHLLELTGPGVALTALDSDALRLERVSATIARLGFEADVRCADASDPESWWDGREYDRILLDAPCSASGVIRRHPDIKHLRRAGDIDALALTQGRLLDAAWTTLRPGGRLLYVTCSVLAAENQDVIDAFLARHDDAIENRLLPNNNIRDLMIERSSGYQVLPGTRDMDGFFFACLDKRA